MINIEKIEELKELPYENGTLFHFLFNVYVQDCENTLSCVDQLFKSNNNNELFKKIHYLKSSCANIGAKETFEICRIICRDIENKNEIGFEQIEDLKHSIKNSINEIKTYT